MPHFALKSEIPCGPCRLSGPVLPCKSLALPLFTICEVGADVRYTKFRGGSSIEAEIIACAAGIQSNRALAPAVDLEIGSLGRLRAMVRTVLSMAMRRVRPRLKLH